METQSDKLDQLLRYKKQEQDAGVWLMCISVVMIVIALYFRFKNKKEA